MGENIYRVVICDDSKAFCGLLAEKIRESEEFCQNLFFIEEVYSAEELLEIQTEYDLLFLDIHLPGMEGYEVAKIINRKQKKPKIVIVTSEYETIQEAFKVGAFRFLKKPFYDRELQEVLLALSKEKRQLHRLQVTSNGIHYDVTCKDIVFMTSKKTYTMVFLINNHIVTISRSLTKVLEDIDYREFVEPIRGTAVNLYHVKQIKDDYLIMMNDQKIRISTRKRKSIKEAFLKYGL